MKHLHKCRKHSSCVIVIERGSPIEEIHIGQVGNIDGSCPYHGLHLSHSVFDECLQEPEEVTDEFDTTHNQVTVRGEAAIIQHDIEQSQLTIDQAIRLGYIKGPISGTGVEPGGVVTPSDGSDRPTGERKNSVGWRRRGEVANELGILHEEGGDQ
jgi:hypothetical protein